MKFKKALPVLVIVGVISLFATNGLTYADISIDNLNDPDAPEGLGSNTAVKEEFKEELGLEGPTRREGGRSLAVIADELVTLTKAIQGGAIIDPDDFLTHQLVKDFQDFVTEGGEGHLRRRINGFMEVGEDIPASTINFVLASAGLPSVETLASGEPLASRPQINLNAFADNQIISLPGTRVVQMDAVKMRELYEILENPRGRVVAIYANSDKQATQILRNFKGQGIPLDGFLEDTLTMRLAANMDLTPLENLFDGTDHIADCTLDRLDEPVRELARQV